MDCQGPTQSQTLCDGRSDGSAAQQTRADASARGERGEDTKQRPFPLILFFPPLCERGHTTELIAAKEQGNAQLNFMKHPLLSFLILLQVPNNCYLHWDYAASGSPAVAPCEKTALLLPSPQESGGDTSRTNTSGSRSPAGHGRR